ncbi:VOC family protein [uncultured Tateyamaria sp.]|uniref:VOC family protein n=1 Tax=uncultured Tateyamaria sp. TaxID=455651 RepID=UPI00262A4619|nr:VOC family protein [uncultured Tateyamaria sp.]
MQIEKLDHVNLRTAQLDAMIAWYRDILGLRRGERPDFGFGGAWMYAGDTAAVHLVEVDGAPGAGSELSLKLEHFAFTASGVPEAFAARLTETATPFRRSESQETGLIAFNIRDPDGNHIHVDFANAG